MGRTSEDSNHVEALVQQKVDAALISSKYFSIALSNFRTACLNSKDLKHLSTFHELVEHELSKRITAALSKAESDVNDLVKEAMQQLLFITQMDNTFHKLEFRISRCIVKHVINFIKVQQLTMPATSPSLRMQPTHRSVQSCLQSMLSLMTQLLSATRLMKHFTMRIGWRRRLRQLS